MFTLVQFVQITTAFIALGGIVFALRQNSKTPLTWIWCVFCLGMGSMALNSAFNGQLGVLSEVLFIASIITCGFSWLLARALFRPSPGFDWKHIAIVAIVASTYAFDRFLPGFVSSETLASNGMVSMLKSLDNFQIMAVSIFMVFSVVEVSRAGTSHCRL